MAIKEDVEDCTHREKEIREPLVHASNGHPWMVYFTTFIAVCGSYEFGACAGYSSPTQTAIRQDLSLSLAEYSLFGSILTFGAMVGAITSGYIADFIGRKGVNLKQGRNQVEGSFTSTIWKQNEEFGTATPTLKRGTHAQAWEFQNQEFATASTTLKRGSHAQAW